MIYKFRDLKFAATKFFFELATMPYFKIFITTNWDRNFEEYCNAKPFVYDPDMRFWELPYRKVLKVHGSLDDYSSMVITRTDYNKCLSSLQNSLIGSKLKDLFTTKTCLFVGYSLQDEDIQEMFSFVTSALGKFSKRHYFISPYDLSGPLPENIHHIKTDGTYFLSELKEHMSTAYCYLPDEVYDHVQEELDELIEDHIQLSEKFEILEHPQVIITHCYQDGLIHGYKRILDGRDQGRFSDIHHVTQLAHNYETKIKSYRKKKSYVNVAYFRGYQLALLALVYFKEFEEEYSMPPRFYYEKIGLLDKEEYFEKFVSLPELHKAAFKNCQKCLKDWNIGPGFVFQHQAWG